MWAQDNRQNPNQPNDPNPTASHVLVNRHTCTILQNVRLIPDKDSVKVLKKDGLISLSSLFEPWVAGNQDK